MEFEWDIAKNESNFQKHGLSFESVHGFEWDQAVIDVSSHAGEVRYVAYGYVGERLHVIVLTLRGEKLRIISVRKAHPKEVERVADI